MSAFEFSIYAVLAHKGVHWDISVGCAMMSNFILFEHKKSGLPTLIMMVIVKSS